MLDYGVWFFIPLDFLLSSRRQRRPMVLLLWDLNASGADVQLTSPHLLNWNKIAGIIDFVTDLVLQYCNAIPAIDHNSATINGKQDFFEAVYTMIMVAFTSTTKNRLHRRAQYLIDLVQVLWQKLIFWIIVVTSLFNSSYHVIHG
ncbi:hypothetical protein NE237_006632 [Protea cynaroides]|uniref:Uncharacterized protein n=1 Tax=Protea cynaroides TaxID=273540 RepID=A0A9Q0KMN3_9MAGN|nr:hypothetical protein NE237_006632 [Protea cynaroides]